MLDQRGTTLALRDHPIGNAVPFSTPYDDTCRMSQWPTVVIGIVGSFLAAGAGLLGGVIVARSASRTAKSDRLRALYRPVLNHFLTLQSACQPPPAEYHETFEEQWRFNQLSDLAQLARAVADSVAMMSIDPDASEVVPIIERTREAGNACWQRVESIASGGYSVGGDGVLPQLLANFDECIDELVERMRTQIGDLDPHASRKFTRRPGAKAGASR